MNVRKYLAELMGTEKITDEDIRKELEELKIDNKLEALSKDGHLAADPVIQEIARAAIKGQATPEQIEQLLRAPRPLPAQTTTLVPPTGPVDTDPVEAAIQTEMTKSSTPYHVAAGVVAAGGAIAPGGNQ